MIDNKEGFRNLVGVKNGNKLDCCLENFFYCLCLVVSCKRKISSKIGYIGVYKENNRYWVVIFVDWKLVYIGMFVIVEEVVLVYNKKLRELYGEDGKINVIKI